MLAFICSMLTLRLGLPNMPLRDCTDRVAGITSKRPGSTWTNSTRSPASTFKARRTSAGTVIWPLLVTVAVDRVASPVALLGCKASGRRAHPYSGLKPIDFSLVEPTDRGYCSISTGPRRMS